MQQNSPPSAGAACLGTKQKNEPQWELEKIVAKRKNRETKEDEFKVQWVQMGGAGGENHEVTWESRGSVEDQGYEAELASFLRQEKEAAAKKQENSVKLAEAKKTKQGVAKGKGGSNQKEQGVVRPFDFILVLDFEATCEKDVRDFPHEIIEFPVVLIDVAKVQAVAEFSSYVKPKRNKGKLTQFCTDLTGITQDQVDAAPPLEEVIKQFTKWFEATVPPNAKAIFATDGPWDLRNFMCQHSVVRDGVEFPKMFYSYIDVRHCFANHMGTKPRGILSMLTSVGLEFQGRQHCGLDDTRNIARIVLALMEKGYVWTKVTKVQEDKIRQEYQGEASGGAAPPSNEKENPATAGGGVAGEKKIVHAKGAKRKELPSCVLALDINGTICEGDSLSHRGGKKGEGPALTLTPPAQRLIQEVVRRNAEGSVKIQIVLYTFGKDWPEISAEIERFSGGAISFNREGSLYVGREAGSAGASRNVFLRHLVPDQPKEFLHDGILYNGRNPVWKDPGPPQSLQSFQEHVDGMGNLILRAVFKSGNLSVLGRQPQCPAKVLASNVPVLVFDDHTDDWEVAAHQQSIVMAVTPSQARRRHGEATDFCAHLAEFLDAISKGQ